MRRLSLLPLVLLLAASGVAGEPAADGARDEAWEAAKAWLFARERMGGLDEEALVLFDGFLPGWSPQALDLCAQTREVWQMPDERRVPVEHALRSLAWLRRVGPHLRRGPRIALLLGRPEGRAWEEALVALCREPFGEPLGRVADILSRHEAGPCRAMAGVLVQYLTAFCGGRDSAWGRTHRTGWDPTPLARTVALRLLDDANPAVTCRFVRTEAFDLEDRWVVDALVRRLDDGRQMPRVHRGLLAGGEERVGEACLRSLYVAFHFRRKPSPMSRVRPAHAMPSPWRVTRLPAVRTADAIRAFWHQVGDRWRFVPDGEAWATVLDARLALAVGETRRMKTPFGDLVVTLTTYAEGYDSHTGPVFTIDVDLDLDGGGQVWNVGNPRHHLGFVAGGTVGGGVWEKTSLLFAPRNEEGVRMRLRVWTTRSPLPGDDR